MASGPTQELPPWLSYSMTTVTTDGGVPIATSSTLVFLPLTYYGPSIPLGTDGVWVYGGSTSPASSSTLSSSTPPSSTPPSSTPPSSTPPSSTPSSTTGILSTSTVGQSSSTTPTPSTNPATSLSSLTTPPASSSSSSSSSPLPSASSSLPSSSQSSFPSSSSTSSTSSSTLAPTSSHLRNSYIGAIVGSIVAAVVLLLLALLWLRCSRDRRRRLGSGHDLLTPPPERHSRHSRQSGVVFADEDAPLSDTKEPRETIWTGWSMVHSGGSQPASPVPPVEGSWTLVDGDKDRIPGEGSPRGSGEEADPFLKRSTYATPGDLPQANPSARLVTLPATPSGVYSATQNSADSASTGASGYGTVVDPSVSRLNIMPPISQWGYILPPAMLMAIGSESAGRDSIIEEADEQDAPLIPPPPLDPDRRRSRISQKSQDSIGSLQSGTPHSLDETAQLMTARKVGRAEARQVPSPTSEFGASPSRVLSGPLAALGRMSWFKRISGGAESTRNQSTSYVTRALTDADVEFGRSTLGVGVWPDGSRPISGHSARSADSNGTVYHDARSRPETPVLTHPPAAVTASRSRLGMTADTSTGIDNPIIRVVESEPPPEYEDLDTTSSTLRDVLDSPAPRPASPFASSSATIRTAVPAYPPGLLDAQSWQESLSTLADPSSNRRGGGDGGGDILEDDPPAAGERWLSLTGGQGHRDTSEMPPMLLHPRDITQSDVGSLYSMRSHLSPRSAFNVSGSAPASLFQHTPDSSMGTNSSRHSRAKTGESSGASIAHSGSVSSTGRRRRPDVQSHALQGSFGRMSVGATGTDSTRLVTGSPIPPSPLGPYYGDSLTSATVSIDRGSNVTTEAVDPVTGMVLHLPRSTVGRENGHWTMDITD